MVEVDHKRPPLTDQSDRGPRVLAIPGTGNPDHPSEKIAAAMLRLSAEELAGLE